MNKWILSLSDKQDWSVATKHHAKVEDWDGFIASMIPELPDGISTGDLCYLAHRGKIQGYMEVVGAVERQTAWSCSTTGANWPPGCFVLRSGPFVELDEPEDVESFKGIRPYLTT